MVYQPTPSAPTRHDTASTSLCASLCESLCVAPLALAPRPAPSPSPSPPRRCAPARTASPPDSFRATKLSSGRPSTLRLS